MVLFVCLPCLVGKVIIELGIFKGLNFLGNYIEYICLSFYKTVQCYENSHYPTVFEIMKYSANACILLSP